MNDETTDKLKKLLKEHSTDGRITCEEAWQIADEIGTKKHEVGKTADEIGIRIQSCQLGCF